MKVEVDMKHLVSLVIRELKSLKGNDRLDITNIKNGENLAIAAAKKGSGGFDMSDQRWHGSGGGSSGGSFTVIPATETPDMSNTIFTFPTATAQPSFIISDNALMRPVTASGDVNWTWNNVLKQATLSVPPNEDIVAIT